MTLRDDPRPREVFGPWFYWPGTPSQWREATVDDCTWYATEFLFEAASETHHSVHPVKQLRNHSIDTQGGTPLRVALSETMRLWPPQERVTYRYGAFTAQQIMDYLRAGAGILWGGDYEQLPHHYRRWTINDYFDHAAASLGLEAGGRTFWYDPLGGGPTRQPYDGEWIKLDALLDFNWQSGIKYYVGIVFNRGNLRVAKMTAAPLREARLKTRAPLRQEPRANGQVMTRFFNEDAWRPLYMRNAGDWWVSEKVLNGEIVWGWVHTNDIIERRSIEPPTDNTDVEALKQVNAALRNQLAAATEKLDAVREEVC